MEGSGEELSQEIVASIGSVGVHREVEERVNALTARLMEVSRDEWEPFSLGVAPSDEITGILADHRASARGIPEDHRGSVELF